MGDTAVLEHYLAPLRPHLEPADVTELVINRPGEIGVERTGGWRWLSDPTLNAKWLETLARAAAAFTTQDVGAETPICSTVLPAGERCQIVLPPAAGTTSITLRKPSAATLTLDDFERGGLFETVRISTPDLSAIEQELLTLRDAGDWKA